MGGDSSSTLGPDGIWYGPGVYGTLGTPAAGNIPGGRIGSASWTDQSGNFWLFGGWGFDANNNAGDLNDLWEFNPSSNQWTWVGGRKTTGIGCGSFNDCGWAGVYGTLGSPATGNIPGSRQYATTWVDLSGNFWLFGGYAFDASGFLGPLNDLWEFNPTTKEWAWISGGSADYSPGVYGTPGSPAAGNTPGSRMSASGWTDNAGNLWLFGGYGLDANGNSPYLNDLWEFNPTTKEWAWMSGSSSAPAPCTLGCSVPGVNGTLGVPAAGNMPEGRTFAATWTDSGGNLWLFGGTCFIAGNPDQRILLNDLWVFIPSLKEWAWIGGTSALGCTGNQPGVYGTLGAPATGNIPGSRTSVVTWTDDSGNFLLFGGAGIDSAGGIAALNDLWEFNPSTKEWTWMSGSSAGNQPGVFGTLGVPAAGNIPAGRYYSPSWIDGSGNLWLFGGLGTSVNGGDSYLNDVWVYEVAPSLPPAATPTFSVPAGTYTSAQSVTINDTTSGAIIYYAIDSVPTTNSNVYSGPITVSTSETLEAIATATGYSNSGEATAAYTITNNGLPATSNTLTASATNFTAGQKLTLTATVMVGNAAVTPGQVSFCDAAASYCTDIHLLGTAQLTSSGTATLNFIPAPGDHSYIAVFLGTTADAGSSSNVVSVTVTASGSTATTTTIAQSGVPGNYALTATVTGQGIISPTGTVSFLDTSNANYVLGTAALSPLSGTNTLSFINSSSPATNPWPQSVAVGDFNGDGKLDLVVPVYSIFTPLSGVNLLLGNGDGTFSAGPTVPATGLNVNNAVVADFNGDGNADLALSLPDNDEVLVLLGNGNGTFNALTPIAAGTVWQVATGDFNSDGKADLVILNCAAKSLTILLGNGDGTFSPVATSPTFALCPVSVAVGDFNGDGKADLAVAIAPGADGVPGAVVILLGNGDGTFTPTTQSLVTGDSPMSITTGDFRGNGILDLAVANANIGTLNPGTVTVMLGKGDGTFTPTTVSPVVGSMPYSVAVGDFNGDGKADLVTANVGDKTVTVLLGNGDGTFTTVATPAAGTGTLFGAVGDFNGDGLSDIAIADNSAGKVTVLLAQETDTATATVTGISPVGTGTHLVDASYPGDGNYSGSISATTSLTAEPASTALSLSANPTSSTFGQQVLLTATLTPSQAQNHNASGLVTFFNGATSLGTGVVSNGVATLNTTTLPAGNDSITATYPGDTNFAASSSSALPFPVAPGITSTTTSLTALPSTLTVGQTLTLTATVTQGSGASPTGTVTFLNGATSLGNATLNGSGVATLQLTPAVGSYSITASYGGSSTDSSSVSSPPVAVTVNTISTTTALTVAPTILSYGQTMTLTATVTPTSGAIPTGTVTFLNGATSLGSAPLNGSGVVTLQLTPDVGNYSITASYGGSPTDSPSNWGTINASVIAAATATTLTASPNPAPFGAAVTFTATVANSVIGSSFTPTGSISFYDGTNLLTTVTLASGTATYSTSALNVGSHNITASYAGGAEFNASISPVVAEEIFTADFNISAAPSSQSVYTGQAASYTVTIVPGTGFNLPVTLTCSQLPANATCNFSPSTVPGGSTSSTLTVQTNAPGTAANATVLSTKLRVTLLAGLFLIFIPPYMRRRHNIWPWLLMIVALLAAGTAINGCGAPSPVTGGTPLGSQTVAITATATNGNLTLTHVTTVALNVVSLF
ncbi:MAG: Ig-like domain repeat protein [Terracidiphilus sp.]